MGSSCEEPAVCPQAPLGGLLKVPFFSTLLGKEVSAEDLAKALTRDTSVFSSVPRGASQPGRLLGGSREVRRDGDLKGCQISWDDSRLCPVATVRRYAVRFTAGMEALEAAAAPAVFLEIGQGLPFLTDPYHLCLKFHMCSSCSWARRGHLKGSPVSAQARRQRSLAWLAGS